MYPVISQLDFPASSGFVLHTIPAIVIIDFGEEVQIPILATREQQLRGRNLSEDRSSPSLTQALTIQCPQADRIFLRAWITRKLDRLVSNLTHLGAYQRPGRREADFFLQWKDILTLRDTFDLLLQLAISDDPRLIVQLFFDVLDRLAGLSKRTPEEIANKSFVLKLAKQLRDEKDDVFGVLAGYLETSWTAVEVGLWEGVLDGDARLARQIALGLNPRRMIDPSLFATKLLGAHRNLTHGYRLDREEFEDLLIRHDGGIPKTIRSFATGLWFGLLCSPELFLRRGDMSFKLSCELDKNR